jgi:hypothetical protein
VSTEASADIGVLLWMLLFTLAWLNARRVKRKTKKVSRNTETGPKWEQIEVYDEVFEEDDW